MKKIAVIIALLICAKVNAQVSWKSFSTLNQMRTDNGNYLYCAVTNLDSGGVFVKIPSSATIDNLRYYAANNSSYRWLKIGAVSDVTNFITLNTTQTVPSSKTFTRQQFFQVGAGVLNWTGQQLSINDSASNNIYIGASAGQFSGASNSDNIAVGRNSQRLIGAGLSNTSVGSGSLNGNTGNRNTTTGANSLAVTDSSDNTGAGYAAGVLNFGQRNTAIGSGSGNYIITDSTTVNNTTIVNNTKKIAGASIASFITSASLTVGQKYAMELSFLGTPPAPFNPTSVLYVQMTVSASDTLTMNQPAFTSQGSGTFKIYKASKQSNAIAIGYGVQTDSSNQVAIGNNLNNTLKMNKFIVDLTSNPSTSYVLTWTGSKAQWASVPGAGGGSYSFVSPLSLSGSAVSIPVATSSVNGYLSSSDWTTFNGKIGVSSPSTGDILYYNGGWQKLAIGTAGQTLHVVGGVPVWRDTSASANIDYSYHTLTFGATTTINYNTGQKFTITLTGNTTFAFSNVVNGETIYVYVTQDGTGGRTITFPSNTVFPLGSNTGLVLNTTTTAGASDKISITYNNITGNYEVESAKDYGH